MNDPSFEVIHESNQFFMIGIIKEDKFFIVGPYTMQESIFGVAIHKSINDF